MGNSKSALGTVIQVAVEEMIQYIGSKSHRSTLLRIGHDRFKVIDRIMTQNMGRNVQDYWDAQSTVYKSMLRRRIWEQALAHLREEERAGTLGQVKRHPLTSLESLIDSASAFGREKRR